MCINRLSCHIQDKLATPCYLFDIDKLHEEVVELQQYIPKERIIYAIKANPFIIKYLLNEVAGFEVCSLGELNICISQNVPPQKITIAGVNKSSEYITQALEYGVTRYIIESTHQWQLVKEHLNKAKFQNINILLRVNIGNQFGMEPDEMQELNNSFDCSKCIRGFHIYMGTQNFEIEKIKLCINQLKTAVDTVSSIDIHEITVGVGFPVHYFNDHNLNNEELIPTIVNDLENTFENHIIKYEVGRKIAASCGQYYTRVVELRKRKSKHFAIVDGGTHQINYYGQLYGRRLPYITQYPLRNETVQYTLCGSLCSASDILVHNHKLGLLQEGDILCFENAGAYSATEGHYLFLTHPLPAIYIFDKKEGLHLLRNKTDTEFINGGYS